ncbi:thialysine N-epsilon-acetyltransferase-like isoform X2 [Ascaphus truei]|uniref:thialysine N-epsilon-acetyltransferase-like isoform X2 n=1 Tax=Ascaphus truei TaxID=8439 RepID=UPI003F5A2F95
MSPVSLDLLRDGFGDSPWFRCLVAERPDEERSDTGGPFAGYALFANSYSSWTGRTVHLQDLYVAPHFRGRGLGKQLMRRVSQELAEYEKLLDQVKITAEGLMRDGFGESPVFRCLVAELGGGDRGDTGPALVGYALSYLTYSTWKGRSLYLEDLYIMPEYRGKGIGSRLLAAVAESCLSLGCSHLQFSVLDWNQPSISFYLSRGARDLSQAEGWRIFRFLPDDLRRMTSDPGHSTSVPL